MAGVRIRPGRPEDALAMGRVYAESWRAGYRGLISEDFLSSLTAENCAPSPENVKAKACLVAEDAGIICGLTAFGPARDGSHMGEIYTFYVLPAYWRQGIGRVLMREAAAVLAERHDRLCLWTLAENVRARAFYERMGLRHTGMRTIAIAGQTLEEAGYQGALPMEEQ